LARITQTAARPGILMVLVFAGRPSGAAVRTIAVESEGSLRTIFIGFTDGASDRPFDACDGG